MQAGRLNYLYDANQCLNSTLQHDRRTVYWPQLHDIIELVQNSKPCQCHSNKKPANLKTQLTATDVMELLGMDLAITKANMLLSRKITFPAS